MTVGDFAGKKGVSRQSIYAAIERGEIDKKDICNVTFIEYTPKNNSWKPSKVHVANGKKRVKK